MPEGARHGQEPGEGSTGVGLEACGGQWPAEDEEVSRKPIRDQHDGSTPPSGQAPATGGAVGSAASAVTSRST